MAIPEPRMRTARLELRNRYYAVPLPNDAGFAYFPIVTDEDIGKPFLRMIKPPPTLLEGFAIINKQLFRLTAQDILRRVVRKSNLVTLESINGPSSTGSTTDGDNSAFEHDDSYIEYGGRNSASAIDAAEIIQRILGADERSVGGIAGMEVSSAADLAWAGQISSLLSDQTEEEGNLEETWEIEDLA